MIIYFNYLNLHIINVHLIYLIILFLSKMNYKLERTFYTQKLLEIYVLF